METSKSKKTIEQLARELKRDVKEVSKIAAQQFPGLSRKDVRDPQYLLSLAQCNQLRIFFESKTEDQNTNNPSDNPSDEKDDSDGANSEPLLSLLSDPIANLSELKFGNLNHEIWLHSEVSEFVERMSEIRNRLGIVLQHLGAYGRTTIVKGCNEESNRGWFRSPLGGNGGMQYYLWWAPKGNAPVKMLNLPDGAIVIRAVRHHDNHNFLSADKEENYYIITTSKDLNDDTFAGIPWTRNQLNFIESDRPVRLAIGRPGSGKTTVLWKAIEARNGQRTLYLTWSRELTQYAKEHFEAFAPKDTFIEARDFTSFIGEICGIDIERQSLSLSQKCFEEAISLRGANQLGVWANRKKSLFAEIRAFLLGCAIPGEEGCIPISNTVRLSDEEYLTQRGDNDGIGYDAARALLSVIPDIEENIIYEKI